MTLSISVAFSMSRMTGMDAVRRSALSHLSRVRPSSFSVITLSSKIRLGSSVRRAALNESAVSNPLAVYDCSPSTYSSMLRVPSSLSTT